MTFKPSHVHIGTDHAAFELKEYLVGKLTEAGYQVVDHGAASYDCQDDYPDYCIPCAQAVVAEPGSLGIVLGGSGNGEQITANKVRGIRAALAYTVEIAERWRMQPLGSERVRIINDAYNANPDSMAGALRTLAEVARSRKASLRQACSNSWTPSSALS